MNILEDLKLREIFNDITNIDKFNSLKKGVGVYIGFDPTAESLHLGNYVQIATLIRFKKAGFKPIAVLGGATGMIGDPSGKNKERNLLNENDLSNNKEKIKRQLESYGVEVIDNYSFYKDMSIVSFLRNVGKLINVNYMINKEVVSKRLEHGISFTEFTYQLLQGWDFKELYEKHGVCIQVGGSDQWGNITTGIEIIRKVMGDENKAVGITTNLLKTSSGKKFGKSEGNAIWIDRNMTTPFAMYQYLMNVADDDLKKIFSWLTFLDYSEIEKIIDEHNEDPSKRMGQKRLSFEIVKDIFSRQEAMDSEKLTSVLFSGGSVKELSNKQKLSIDGSVPTFEKLSGNILDVLVEVGAAQSKNEARQFISSSAVEVDGVTILDVDFSIDKKNDGDATLLKRGKKKFFLIKY